MVRFPSLLYPFSILLIFSSSDRLLLYRTCHRCAANARIYAVMNLLNLNCKRCWLALSNLFISISLCRNLTLNDLGRCCGIRVTRQCTTFSNYWSDSLLDYQKFVALAYQRFKISTPEASGNLVYVVGCMLKKYRELMRYFIIKQVSKQHKSFVVAKKKTKFLL